MQHLGGGDRHADGPVQALGLVEVGPPEHEVADVQSDDASVVQRTGALDRMVGADACDGRVRRLERSRHLAPAVQHGGPLHVEQPRLHGARGIGCGIENRERVVEPPAERQGVRSQRGQFGAHDPRSAGREQRECLFGERVGLSNLAEVELSAGDDAEQDRAVVVVEIVPQERVFRQIAVAQGVGAGRAQPRQWLYLRPRSRAHCG